jgi:O-antigen/teichoic acid export membrane protein
MNETLKQKTAKGFFWGFIEQIGLQGIHFVVGVILARLLTPSDYGMVGMLSVFIAISQTLVNSGFNSAYIRKKERTEEDASTVLFFNIAAGIIVYFALYLISPAIAVFYKTPELESITRIIALTIVINSFGLVQSAKLIAAVDFRTTAKVSVIASVCAGFVGIFLAYSGFGVYALVWSQITRSLVNTSLLWVFAKWCPILSFSIESFQSMFSFGSKLMVSGLVNTFYQNIIL